MSENRGLVRGLAWVGIALGTVAVGLGMLGSVWPLGDSFAVGRLVAAVWLGLVGLLSFCVRLPRIATLAVALAIGTAATCFAPRAAPQTVGGITLYQKNILFWAHAPEAQAADIQRHHADIVTLQEVRADARALRRLLSDSHPHQAWCPFSGVGGTAVLSRWPFTAAPRCGRGYTAGQVAAPDGPLWVISVHLHWPAPFGQRAQIDRIITDLRELTDAPIILAGDFNMVPWAAGLRDLRRATGTTWQGPPRGTLPLARHAGLGESQWPALPIDHVFPPQGWGMELTLRPRIGSDHLGLVARAALR